MAPRFLITGLGLSFVLGGAAAAAVAGGKAPSTQVQTSQAWSAAVRIGDKPESCRKLIGLAPARALARYCRYVSSATHPPCNTLNNCALIVDEIHRTTVGDQAPLDPKQLPGSEGLTAAQWREIARLRAI